MIGTKILEIARSLFSFRFLENIGEGAGMALSYFFIMGANSDPFIDLTVIEGWISLGMFIIIWYGVMKIILNLVWLLLFGKKFGLNIGILEFFHNKLKPVQAQRIVDSNEKEFEEQVKRKEKRINKMRKSLHKTKDNWRCYQVGKIKNALDKFNANKYTILGSVAAAGSVGVGMYDVMGLDATAISSMGIIDALTAGGFLGAGVLTLKGVFGKGLEGTAEYKERKKAEKENKLAAKEFNIDAEAQKFVEKLGVSKERGIELAKDKKDQLEKQAKEAEEKALNAKAAKMAKKNGISQEAALKAIQESESNNA